jgi:REP element-mobilizing transposase RayT
MSRVLAYHVVFSTYGFWLPNDPRGSNSDAVWAPHLHEFGQATKVQDRRSHATDAHNRLERSRARKSLRYPPVRFSGVQARAVGRGFARCVGRTGAVIFACAIMPDHVHLVIDRHRYEIEKLITLLKGDATRVLQDEKLHPLADFVERQGRVPTPWGESCRKVFLFDLAQVRDRIDYVNANPLRQGKRSQQWSFVHPLDGNATSV